MYPRWLWPGFALPGVVWLLILFLLPFYAVIGVAFGSVDPILFTAGAGLEPARLEHRLGAACADRAARPAASTGSSSCAPASTCRSRWPAASLIGYPVAYYIARHASRTKSLLLILLILPFWISYLMRMLAWVNLLAPDGYVNRFLDFTRSAAAHHLHHQPAERLPDGQSFTVILALDLRLHPLLHPAALRLARPHRQVASRGRARPRRQPVPHVPARDAAALEDRPPGRRAC